MRFDVPKPEVAKVSLIPFHLSEAAAQREADLLLEREMEVKSILDPANQVQTTPNKRKKDKKVKKNKADLPKEKDLEVKTILDHHSPISPPP